MNKLDQLVWYYGYVSGTYGCECRKGGGGGVRDGWVNFGQMAKLVCLYSLQMYKHG